LGDAYGAAQWIEYANGSPNTIGGRWRRNNGHGEPFGVRVWCVGNGMYGPWQLGFMPLWQYVIRHRLFAEAMGKVDREIALVGVGDLNTKEESDDREAVDVTPLERAPGEPWILPPWSCFVIELRE